MPSTPPAETSQQQQNEETKDSSTSEPLAKRVKPNPEASTGGGDGLSLSGQKSPPTVLPFDPAHPGAMSSGGDGGSDRPSLPSMAALMSPDPNAPDRTTLPAPPNTAAFPPSAGPGGGMHHHAPPLGLGFGAAPVAPLQIQLLTQDAKAPQRGSAFAAGYDIYAAEAASVPKGGRKLVSTGIACAVPSGTYARIAPRSGLAVKHGIATGAGVVDEDYRGEVKVLLFNHGDADFEINVGDRIAQMVLERIVTPEVATVEKLEESARGAGGFGSTGGFGGAL